MDRSKILKISSSILVFILVGVFIFSIHLSLKRYEKLKNIEALNKIAFSISYLVHRLQQERGASAGYIASKGKKFEFLLKKHRKLTNQAIKEFYATLKKTNCHNKMLEESIKNAEFYLNNLNYTRARITSLNVSFSDEIDYFSKTNKEFLLVLENIVKLANDVKLLRSLNTYANFQNIKENIGIERAILSAIFTQNYWTKTEYIRFVKLISQNKAFKEAMEITTFNEVHNFYIKKIKENKDLFDKVQQYENIALNKEKNFGVDGEEWFEIITQKINILHEIDNFMNHFNQQLIQQLRHDLLIKNILLFIFIILFNIFIAFMMYIFKQEHNELLKNATIDKLTGLYNRNFLMSEFEILRKKAKKYNNKIVVMFIDLDYFKEINDSYGHKSGDMVLKEIANRIKRNVSDLDIVARFGGDEFVVLFSDIDDMDAFLLHANVILKDIREPIYIDNKSHRISASIGVSIYPNDGEDIETLIRNADLSMYHSKESGKDRVSFYSYSMTEQMQEKLDLKNELYRALENDEFEVFYQPQFDVNGRLVGMESLLRWNHPKKGLITPDKFLDVASSIGLTEKIDFTTFKKALTQFKIWYENGYKPGVLSLNITPKNLESKNFVERLKDIIDIPVKYISIEITENSLLKNPDRVKEILFNIKSMGISISIDDFGTGYSSLNYLTSLPIDKLKIDKSFVDDVLINEHDEKVVGAIISLAKELNIKVIVEGVEEKAQFDFLVKEGADYIQGYYFSKPLTAKEIEEKFLKKGGEKN